MGAISSSESKDRRSGSSSGGSGVVNGASTSDFQYEEFDGKDGKTCPTCQGTGRVSKRQQEELVALIPYSDKRLKPRRTKAYVALAITVCLIICGLLLFFILPRSINIEEGRIQNQTVHINKNLSSTAITVWNQFNISNTNFFLIKVTKISVEAFFDHVSVGQGKLKNVPLSIPARTADYIASVKVEMHFDVSNGLDYIWKVCTESARRVHDIVIKFQATLTSEYLSHSEQDTITAYKYIDCSIQKHF